MITKFARELKEMEKEDGGRDGAKNWLWWICMSSANNSKVCAHCDDVWSGRAVVECGMEMATFDMAQGDARERKKKKTQSEWESLCGFCGLCGLWAICGPIHRCAWPGRSLSRSISLALWLQLKSWRRRRRITLSKGGAEEEQGGAWSSREDAWSSMHFVHVARRFSQSARLIKPRLAGSNTQITNAHPNLPRLQLQSQKT